MKSEIYKQDRFYPDLSGDEVVWMYHNPYAVSGDQFVSNHFDMELMEKAITESGFSPDNQHDVYLVYDYIVDQCRQYLSDVGTEVYEYDKELFESEPFAEGMTVDTLNRLKLLFRARDEINDYCVYEFGHPADFSDLSKVGLAYTTTDDGMHEIQVYANLTEHCTELYYDGEKVISEKVDSLEQYVETVLTDLDFCELTDVSEWLEENTPEPEPDKKDFQFMKLDFFGHSYDACIEFSTYLRGGGMYMGLRSMYDGELVPYADLTVNVIEFPTEPGCALVDTNNFTAAEALIKDYRLGTPTGRYAQSGFCTYPEYRFDMDEVRKYCVNPEDIKDVHTKEKERDCER